MDGLTGSACGGGVESPSRSEVSGSSLRHNSKADAKPTQNCCRTRASSGLVCLRRFEFDVRTSIDDIDQRPPRCPRKSSRSPALPSALTRATYVHPETTHRMRSEEEDEGGTYIERAKDWERGTQADQACVYTEGHPSPGEAPCLAHQGPPQQAHRFREGCCEGGFWVRLFPNTVAWPRADRTRSHHQDSTNPPCTASPPTSVALSNSSVTPRTSARASSRRRGSAPSAVARERSTR